MNYSVKTDRLSLQPLNESDIPFMISLKTRPESYRYEPDSAKTRDAITNEITDSSRDCRLDNVK